MIHIDSVREGVDIVRWYDNDGQESYAQSLPYKAVATLLWTDKSVEVCGLHGVMTRPMREALKTALIERGASMAYAVRHGHYVQWLRPDPEPELIGA